jgi:multicomponent Na+:H+ antiporter subunit D
MADLALKIRDFDNKALVGITSIFFILGFGIKSAVFPLYYWLPSSYHTPPSAVAATFGGLLTKLGIYAILRVFSLIFIPDDFTRTLFMALAVLTVLTGAFGALIKTNIRRMFSYLIVCHIGFMLGGIAMFTKLALMGTVFYLMHDIMVKTNMFLIAGFIRLVRGSMDTQKLGGLYKSYPLISLMIALVLFSLVGIPPLSGFWPKIYLFQEAFVDKQYFFIAALIIGSLVTMYVISKMWADVFWKDMPQGVNYEDKFKDEPPFKKILIVLPILILCSVTLYIGFNAENIITVVDRITNELLDTSPYIRTVLGDKAFEQ